jgi:hypothetical protein
MHSINETYSVRRELRLNPTLDAMLQLEADRLGRGVSAIIRIACEEYFLRPIGQRAKCLELDLVEIQRQVFDPTGSP